MENNRPLITFLLVAYKQEQFITDAVHGAFSQTYTPLEVILSDDCSPDRTFEIMQEMVANYQGPHTIILNRNECNLGLVGHINHAMNKAKGELIVIAAGDDISLAQRTEEIYQAYCTHNKQVYSIFSQANIIDEYGIQLRTTNNIFRPSNFSLRHMAEHQIGLPGSTQAWHKDIFKKFGDLDQRIIQEDVIIPFWAKLLGDIGFINKPLVNYRYHNNNVWQHPRNEKPSHISEWHRQQFEKRIINLIGIWETKIKDVDFMIINCPYISHEYIDLRDTLRKRLDELFLELEFFRSNKFIRIQLLVNALFQKVPLKRLIRWIIQYNWPILFNYLRKISVSSEKNR